MPRSAAISHVSIANSGADSPSRAVGGANIAAPGVVSAGDGMAPRHVMQDRRFPPFAPIPGRGLPPAQPGEIPTRRVRIMRAGGAFVTAFAAAATLSLGPAVVLARLSSGPAVVVVVSVGDVRPAFPVAPSPADLLARCQLVRARADWSVPGPLIIAAGTGAPGGRTREQGATPRRESGSLESGSARFAARRRRWRPGAEAPLTPARRPRPPPVPGEVTAHRNSHPQAFAPATPSLVRWWGPAFSSPRV